MVWGVAGGYCAGKDALVGFLRARGFHEINLDKIGHQVLARKNKEVAARFGADVLDEAGVVRRARLAGIVFRNARARRDLEKILHTDMVALAEEQLKALTGPVVINAAILFTLGLERLCDLVICVRAPLFKRLARAKRRDGSSIVRAWRRICSQRRICPKSNGFQVDIYYVKNSGSLSRFEEQAVELMKAKGSRVVQNGKT
jgi:dephospho-CoA kinase